ncbi:MAG: DJ-1/PfpI family protein, partial [archaeon]
MKMKVVMIIAKEKFRDEELFEPRKLFEDKGIQVIIASAEVGDCIGMMGRKAIAEINYSDIKVDEFDAVIFVGGMGAQDYFQDKKAHEIARQTIEKGKVLGAICIAPSILALAGVLKGKKATVWEGKEFVNYLKDNGANYTGKRVEVDGKIVTGS